MLPIKSEILERITVNTPDLIKAAEAAELWDSESYNQAADLAKFLSEATKNIESERKRITGPINDSLKATNNFFKKASEPLDRALLLIKSKILEYQRKERERAEEIARKLAEEQAAKLAAEMTPLEANEVLESCDDQIKAVASIAPQVARGDYGKTVTQKRWAFTVKDISQVHISLLQVNELAVKRLIAEGERDIPGIEVYQVESLVVR